MFYSTRAKLNACFLSVTLLVGAVSLYCGVHLLNVQMFGEAISRVRLNIDAAEQAYHSRIRDISTALNITTLGMGFRTSLKEGAITDLVNRLERLGQHAELDFAGLVSAEGAVMCRMGPHAYPGPPMPPNDLIRLSLERLTHVEGTVVLNGTFFMAENPNLAKRIRIEPIMHPKQPPNHPAPETRGMALAAAVPVFQDNTLIGVLYGGIVLNHNWAVVDSLQSSSRQAGNRPDDSRTSAAIYIDDLCIVTTVKSADGRRIPGDRVSPTIRSAVLDSGSGWAGRGHIFGDRHIAAGLPIIDLSDRPVGMLIVGVPESHYTAVRHKAIALFAVITLGGMALAAALGCLLAARIMNPVNRLIRASLQVSAGVTNPDIGPPCRGEIAVLQNTFREMLASFRRHREASENQIIHSEKQASVGRLAAGVAHEINNPLTGVLTYTHMLLRRKDLDDEMRSDLTTIAGATERVRKIVKGLLDFARQSKLEPEPTDINRLVRTAVALVENQALVKGVAIRFYPAENLPTLVLDRSQMQSVLINIIINALDATVPGGMIDIFTSEESETQNRRGKGVCISIADTGSGIAPDDLGKLFDPFFTTKPVGQGTGLGLSVSQGIVQRHGGTIQVRSQLGKGSEFRIQLPVNGENAKAVGLAALAGG